MRNFMSFRVLVLLLVSLGAWVFVTSPTVADVLIDDFSTNQGPVTDSTVDATPVINGPIFFANTDLVNARRIIGVNKLAGGAAVIEPTVEVKLNAYNYVHLFPNDGSGEFLIQWDFNAHDLTQGGTLFGFLLEDLSYTHSPGGNLTLNILVEAPSATATLSIPQPQNHANIFVPFALFAGGSPFANATKIVITGSADPGVLMQFALGALRSVTPEPSSIVLFGAGVLGLVLHGVRRRSSITRK